MLALLAWMLWPLTMGMDGGEWFLPVLYAASNNLASYLGAKDGVKRLERELRQHTQDETVHCHRRKDDPQ